MSKRMVGVLVVVAFNVALGVTPQVPWSVTITAWIVTAVLATLWLVMHLAQRSKAEPVRLSGPDPQPSSTLAMLNERGITIDPDVLSRPPKTDD